MFIPRTTYIQEICTLIAEETYIAAIEHFAVPIICGISCEEISEYEWRERYGNIPKPPPLQEKHKITIYNRIKEHFKPLLLHKISEIVKTEVIKSTGSLSYSKLQAFATKIKDMSRLNERDWSRINALFQDHTYLFKELKAKTELNVDVVAPHDFICTIMVHERNKAGFLGKIGVDDILEQNDRGV